MTSSLVTVAYIAASALFILSLGGLSHPETARKGNLYGIIGMIVAIVATTLGVATNGFNLSQYAMLAASAKPVIQQFEVDAMAQSRKAKAQRTQRSIAGTLSAPEDPPPQ